MKLAKDSEVLIVEEKGLCFYHERILDFINVFLFNGGNDLPPILLLCMAVICFPRAWKDSAHVRQSQTHQNCPFYAPFLFKLLPRQSLF